MRVVEVTHMALVSPRLLFTALLLAAGIARACLNSYDENEFANPEGISLRDSIVQHNLKLGWDAVRNVLAQRAAKEPTIENLNDYAVALCHTGDAAAAIKILEGIEKSTPGRYQTATNLGTACELVGNYELALRWIIEGIRRNPQSHEGSEWIHAAILQVKLQLEKDPTWLESHDVLNLDFGTKAVPEAPAYIPTGNKGRILTLEDIEKGLQHQLHERLQFTPKPDALVSQLISDFACLAYLTNRANDPEKSAILLYQLALEYAGMPQKTNPKFDLLVTRTHDFFSTRK